jgi:alpha-ketoglutarate-dependent taurine dioxygenase
MSFMQNRATYSLLQTHEIPPEGGDTEFADMVEAYAALPEERPDLELDLAASHASQIVGWPMPKFVYRHTWKLGDLLMWDSLSTMHRATEFEDGKHRRDMWRTTCRERPVELSAVA